MAINISKLRIINWHYITDTRVLPFTHQNFFTGRNGHGKSTIIDALMTLLFVSRSNYNKANDVSAGKGEGRTLMSYIRAARNLSEQPEASSGKTKVYTRKGEVITHIAAEMYDDKKDSFFTLGVTFKVEANRFDHSNIDGKWWCARDIHLEEIPFVVIENDKKMVLSLDKLKSQLPEKAVAGDNPGFRVFESDSDAKRQISLLFHISREKYGNDKTLERWKKTMLRCVAFKPDAKEMKNSDIFVRNIVLEPNDVDETVLEELLVNLQDACNGLNAIQEQHAKLQKILDLGDEYHELSKHQHLLQSTSYLVDKLALEAELEEIDRKSEVLAVAHQAKEAALQNTRHELRTLQDELRDLEHDPNIEGQTPLRREIAEYEDRVKALGVEKEKLLKNLEKVKYVADGVDGVFGERIIDTSKIDKALAGDMISHTELQDIVANLESVEKKLREHIASLTTEMKTNAEKMGELREELESLKMGQVRPEASAKKLKDVISRKFRECGIADIPKYLYELLDYKNDKWAPATEAHMGRKILFSVVVAPENYRLAARMFRSRRDDINIAGAILIDTKAFATEEITIEDNSLAANLTTDNPFVRQYINYRYNNVILVEDAAEQEGRGTYLDLDGMRYSAYSLTKLSVPQFPIIGATAKKERQAYVEEELASIERSNNELRKLNSNAGQVYNAFFSSSVKDLYSSAARDQLQHALELPNVENALAAKIEQYKELTSSAPFQRLAQVEAAIKAKEAEVAFAENEARDTYRDWQKINDEQDNTHNKLVNAEDILAEMEISEPDVVAAAKAHLAALQKQFPKRGLARHGEEIFAEINATKKQKEQVNIRIGSEQAQYNGAFGAGAPPEGYGHQALHVYRKTYDRLNSKELPEAYRKSELYNKQMTNLLQTQLLTHLKTSISDARDSLDVLNKTLRTMVYNGQFYQFAKIKPAKGKEEFYEVINNFDSSSLQNFSFLSSKTEEDFDEEERIIRDLVEKLRLPKSERGENWLDYRTYCEFAIDVVSADNASHRNKLDNAVAQFSGAEVQIPFYMILTASLANIYAQGTRLTAETMRNSNALRLMIVDECFSKMDTGNTQQLVKYICHNMGLQLVAAAPPSTFGSLAGTIDNVIYVKQEGNFRACFAFTAEAFGDSDDYSEALRGEAEDTATT